MGLWDSTDAVNRLAYAIRAQLIKAGVSVKVAFPDSHEEAAESCHMLLQRLSCGSDPDWVANYWKTEGEWNTFAYSNSDIDECFNAGRLSAETEQRKAAYHTIHQLLDNNCPAIFLATGREYIGSRYNLSDVLDSAQPPIVSLKDWHIYSGVRAQAHPAAALGDV